MLGNFGSNNLMWVLVLLLVLGNAKTALAAAAATL